MAEPQVVRRTPYMVMWPWVGRLREPRGEDVLLQEEGGPVREVSRWLEGDNPQLPDGGAGMGSSSIEENPDTFRDYVPSISWTSSRCKVGYRSNLN